MRLLDLFCGAGGAAMGYARAGFEVTGVDIQMQPRYPFEFIKGDALGYVAEYGHEYDAIHASPPCQKYTRMAQGLLQAQGKAREYPDLIAATRVALVATSRPYVIENVPGAPLIMPFMLCGSSFGLLVQRHRLFETSIFMLTPQCVHYTQARDKPPLHRSQGTASRVVGVYGNGRGKGDTVSLWQKAMGITWMKRSELAQAIPPAYTEYIGHQLMDVLERQAA